MDIEKKWSHKAERCADLTLRWATASSKASLSFLGTYRSEAAREDVCDWAVSVWEDLFRCPLVKCLLNAHCHDPILQGFGNYFKRPLSSADQETTVRCYSQHSVMKSSCCSGREPSFGSQHLCQEAHNHTLVYTPGDPNPYGLREYSHTCGTHRETHIHVNKIKNL